MLDWITKPYIEWTVLDDVFSSLEIAFICFLIIVIISIKKNKKTL